MKKITLIFCLVMLLCSTSDARIIAEKDSDKSFFIMGVAPISFMGVDSLSICFIKHFENEKTDSWISVNATLRIVSASDNILYIDNTPYDLKPILAESKYQRIGPENNIVYFELTPAISKAISTAHKISISLISGKHVVNSSFSVRELNDFKAALNAKAADFEKYRKW